MLRRLRHRPAAGVEALAAGASGDLVEVARAQDGRLLSVELAELAEEHRADGHVDAYAQGVGAAEEFEQSLLGELLDEHTILRQQTGMMQTDAVSQPLADFWSVRTAESEALQRAREGGLLVAGADIDAGEVLRALGRLELSE